MNAIIPQTTHKSAESVLSALGDLYMPKYGWFYKVCKPAALCIEYEPFWGGSEDTLIRISRKLCAAIRLKQGWLEELQGDLQGLIRIQSLAELLKKPAKLFQVRHTGGRYLTKKRCLAV